MTRPGLATIVLCLAAATSATARAQTTGKPIAEALFQDGRALMDEGKTHEACEKFAMSQRIEPKLGTLLNLASCHEAEGKTASAWAEFTEARTQAERADQPEREAFAREHADALAPRLARVSLSAARPQGMTVRIDGVAVDDAVLGTAFPIDPGDHELVASAKGKRDWSYRFSVAGSPGALTIDVPELGDEAPEPAVVTAVAPPPPAREAPAAPRPPPPVVAPSRAPGWIALGAGALAVGMGTYFGLRAFSLKADGEGECTGAECSQTGLDAFDDAEASATASTVAFGTGLLAAGLGVWLLARPAPASKKPTRSSWVQLGPRGAQLGGTW